MAKHRSAFTLLELLIVIAVIAVLSAISLAAVNQMTQQSKAVKSLNNLRQLGIASLAYASENNGQLPQSSHQGPSKAWTKVLKNYNIPAEMFVSPFDTTGRASSYAINDFVTENPFGAETLNFSRLQNLPAPSQTLYMAVLESGAENSDHFHFAEEGYGASQFAQEVWVELTASSSHYLYADGHVKSIRWAEVKTLLNQPDSAFIRPDGKPTN